MAVFDWGDVLSVTLDPAIGHGQRGTRPALVLTTKEFNRLGDVLIAPITQGGEFSRYAGFAVSLMGTGCNTQGVALLDGQVCLLSIPLAISAGTLLPPRKSKMPDGFSRHFMRIITNDDA